MAIQGFTEPYFVNVLNQYVSPSKAIIDPRHLHGREKSLKETRRALGVTGRQVFIYGERGVGKTSLAKTVARSRGEAGSDILLVGCEDDSTFSSVIDAIAKKLLPLCRNKATRTEFTAAIRLLGIDAGVKQIYESVPTARVSDINDAIIVLKGLQSAIGYQPLIIVDEFDRIKSSVEKRRFAEFLKQISDQDLDVKFIFCGIATDIDDLIGSHFSSGRYIEPIELGRLKPGDMFAIAQNACNAFKVNIDQEYLIRSTLISDGYPYFMHLITENLLWAAYEDEALVNNIRHQDFDSAISRAVNTAEPMLKSAYDKATKKYLDDYQEVLWAVSALKLFENKWSDIYNRSYIPMIDKRRGRNALDEETFYQRILKLTHHEHGRILATNQNGWYKFSENVVRSYVRLRASENGVDLGIDLHGA